VSRRVVALLLAGLLGAAASPAAAASAPPAISARSAFLVQPDTRDVIYARRPDARLPVASTTKLMTALVALGRLKLSDIVTVAPYHPAPGESVVGLRAGERMTFADLLRAMMLPSANDAAHAVAVATAGSVRAFVALMNERVRALGLHDTHFANPIGLDDRGNYSSARDLVEMALLLRRNPFIRQITAQASAVLRSGSHERQVVNRNDLVGRFGFVDGVKTGHTLAAGYVLVGAAHAHGVSVLSSVLGDPTLGTRDADSLTLLRYGLRLYQRTDAVRAGHVLAMAGVRDEGDTRAPLAAARTISAVTRRGERLTLRVVGAPKDVQGPLPAGTRVGAVEALRRGEVVGRTDLVTARRVLRPTVPQRVRAWLGRPGTLVLLGFLVACTVLLVLLRRRLMRTRRAVREPEAP
jgi:D-alanyl-D-alanine carboxypeptidase (penicillin-binding protein 5/6)